MIRRQVVIPVTPERLWQALTDPAEMSGWFGARVEWELREGAPARFEDDDGSRKVGRVEAVRPVRHLRFRWWPDRSEQSDRPAQSDRSEQSDRPDRSEESDQFAETDAGEAGVSEVSYLLEPLDDGSSTRLTIQERQVDAARGAAEASASGGSWSAWDTRLAVTWSGLTARTAGVVRA